MEAEVDFGAGKAVDLERIVLSNQKKIERLLRMGSNDSEIARIDQEITTIKRRFDSQPAQRQSQPQRGSKPKHGSNDFDDPFNESDWQTIDAHIAAYPVDGEGEFSD